MPMACMGRVPAVSWARGLARARGLLWMGGAVAQRVYVCPVPRAPATGGRWMQRSRSSFARAALKVTVAERQKRGSAPGSDWLLRQRGEQLRREKEALQREKEAMQREKDALQREKEQQQRKEVELLWKEERLDWVRDNGGRRAIRDEFQRAHLQLRGLQGQVLELTKQQVVAAAAGGLAFAAAACLCVRTVFGRLVLLTVCFGLCVGDSLRSTCGARHLRRRAGPALLLCGERFARPAAPRLCHLDCTVACSQRLVFWVVLTRAVVVRACDRSVSVCVCRAAEASPAHAPPGAERRRHRTVRGGFPLPSSAGRGAARAQRHPPHLWHEAVALKGDAREPPQVLIMGPAGVGKSVSLLYGLKLLLEQDATVVLEHLPSGTAYLFVPSSNGYAVRVARAFRHTRPESFSLAMEDANAVYLVDPGEAGVVTGVTPEPLRCTARAVLVASPDTRHFKEWWKNAGDGAHSFFVPPWTKKQLRAALPWLATHLSHADCDARFHDFGGVVQPLVADRAVLHALGDKQQAALHDDAVEPVTTSALPATMRNGAGPPAVFMHVPSRRSTRPYYFAPVSQYTAAALAVGHFSRVRQLRALRNNRRDMSGWEDIWWRVVRDALAAGGAFQVRRAAGGGGATSTLTLPPREIDEALDQVPLAAQGAWDAFAQAAAAADGTTLLAPLARHRRVVDAVDSARRGFTCALTAKHSGPPVEQLAALLDICGVQAGGAPFQLYYVVPAVLFPAFSVPQCADRRVELWVLRLALADPSPKTYKRMPRSGPVW